MFGISNPCEGIQPGASNSVFRNHESYIVDGGRGGRVYWFYFYKLARRVYGGDIPIYTNKDKKQLLAQWQNDKIIPTLKFKELLDKSISSDMVHAQEYVLRQWYFRRIMSIGDAAHKVLPAHSAWAR